MWLPIEKYDKLKKKPKDCVFWLKEERNKRDYLSLMATMSLSRNKGSRVCTHYKIVGRPDDN